MQDSTTRHELRPFTISVPHTKLEQIRQRVRDYRFPPKVASGGWESGVSHDYMRQLVDYWATEYDWKRFEHDLNRHPQFRATVDGLDIHFYHVLGKGKNPLPLLLTHGWPGSVIEYLYLIDRLTNPAGHGGREEDAFTVVIPSLLGYGWSEKPTGWIGPVKTAALLDKLMAQVLGYPRYGAHAGDLGSLMQMQLASRHGQNLIGAHFLNLAAAPAPGGGQSAEEREWIAQSGAYFQAEMSYFPQQMLKPTTMMFVLEDNPVGAAAWLIEKIWAWSDHKDEFQRLFGNNRILDMVMTYLVTDTMGSAMSFYGAIPGETQWQFHPAERIEIPVAVANFPRDYLNAHPPRAMAERSYNITQWSEFEHGGHFAGLEQPELLIDDIRKFFSALRQ